jgi:ribonuclease Z
MYSFKIIQNWTRDLFHSSALMFDQKIYFFNCSDGTQRNALEQGIKFHKISNFFFNNSHIDAYTGSYGMIMSRNEQITGQLIAHKELEKTKGKKFEPIHTLVKIWGPPFFSTNYSNCKAFFTEKVKETIYDYNTSSKSFISYDNKEIKHFEDENLKIYPICISTDDMTDYVDKNNFAMSYICEPHLKARPFLVEKAKALGLNPGPLYGQLQKGKSVIFEGKEIKPEDVLGDQPPASCIGIFYSPSITHAERLCQDYTIRKFIENKKDRVFSIIVHILGDSNIISKDFYKQFMNSWDTNTIHIIDCKETNLKFMLNSGKHKVRYILNKIDDKLFDTSMFTINDTIPKVDLYDIIKDSNNIISSFPGFEYVLYPIDKRRVLSEKIYEPYIYKNEFFEKYTNKIDLLMAGIERAEREQPVTVFKNEPRVTFLGTVSMKPGIYRNVSGIMIHLNNEYYLLLDCGEGTFQQIYDHFGSERTDFILSRIKLIFITHKHGDHMLGTLKVLSEIDKIKEQNNIDKDDMQYVIYIVAPYNIAKWLRLSIDRDLKYSKHIIIINCDEINPEENNLYDKFVRRRDHLKYFEDIDIITDKNIIYKKIKDYFQRLNNLKVENFYEYINKELGINIFSIEVFHCDESYGCFVEEISHSWKISYSGDTRPCNNFWNYSIASSLFIHESTFDDELADHAHEKLHSTFNEAITIGKENGSWRTALTHVSPRYIKGVPWKPEFECNSILIAHDFMSLKLSECENSFIYAKHFSKIMEEIEKIEILKSEEEDS